MINFLTVSGEIPMSIRFVGKNKSVIIRDIKTASKVSHTSGNKADVILHTSKGNIPVSLKMPTA